MICPTKLNHSSLFFSLKTLTSSFLPLFITTMSKQWTNSHPLVSRKKAELKKAFQPTNSLDKQLKIFKKMEKSFQESELAFECLSIARQYVIEGNPEQVLVFGNRALRIFIENDSKNIAPLGKAFSGFGLCVGSETPCLTFHNSSLYIAFTCNLLASACRELKRYNESLSYLNWANRNFSKLEEEDFCSNNCLLKASRTTQKELVICLVYFGRIEEAVVPMRKGLEIKERIMEEGCIELGKSYEFAFGSYFGLMDYKEALPFCLKTLEVYTKHFGQESAEVYVIMRNLVVVYVELGEYERALEQLQQSQNILELHISELLDIESEHGDILICLGKYEEAIDVLTRVVSHFDTKRETRASSYFTMARAFCCLQKFDEAEKYLRAGLKYPEKMKEDVNNAVRLRNMCTMSRMYEKKDDLENAVFLLGKALIISRIPRKILAEGAARLFLLVSLSGHKEEGIPYMEGVVEKLKEKFGEEDCEVAHGYRNLGAAYLKSGREELAVKFMVKAKDIMDVALGPHHLDSLKTSQALAETYAAMGRYGQALEIQEKTVNGLKVLEPREQEFLDVAVKLLNKMNDIVAETLTRASPQSINDEDLSTMISKCGISDD